MLDFSQASRVVCSIPENDLLALNLALVHHPEVRAILDASTCNIQIEGACLHSVQGTIGPLHLSGLSRLLCWRRRSCTCMICALLLDAALLVAS